MVKMSDMPNYHRNLVFIMQNHSRAQKNQLRSAATLAVLASVCFLYGYLQ